MKTKSLIYAYWFDKKSLKILELASLKFGNPKEIEIEILFVWISSL
jgi:hypothetical protein